MGMNADMMAEYIKFIADRLLIALGCQRLYNASNPFDWMEMISLQCVSSRNPCRSVCSCRASISVYNSSFICRQGEDELF